MESVGDAVTPRSGLRASPLDTVGDGVVEPLAVVLEPSEEPRLHPLDARQVLAHAPQPFDLRRRLGEQFDIEVAEFLGGRDVEEEIVIPIGVEDRRRLSG
jgi:hypothetical protein